VYLDPPNSIQASQTTERLDSSGGLAACPAPFPRRFRLGLAEWRLLQPGSSRRAGVSRRFRPATRNEPQGPAGAIAGISTIRTCVPRGGMRSVKAEKSKPVLAWLLATGMSII